MNLVLKAFIFLGVTLIIGFHTANAQEPFKIQIFASIFENTDFQGRDQLKKSLEFFLKNDFLPSDYCLEGWGDQQSALRMQKACKKAQSELINEFSSTEEYVWMMPFNFNSANINENRSTLIFSRIVPLPAYAPLSCILFIEFSIDFNKQLLSDPSLDLYCDH